MTKTGAPDAERNTSDLAIWATEQRSTEAASADVLAGTSYSTIAAATPAAFKASWTRCAEVDKSFAMMTAHCAPARKPTTPMMINRILTTCNELSDSRNANTPISAIVAVPTPDQIA